MNTIGGMTHNPSCFLLSYTVHLICVQIARSDCSSHTVCVHELKRTIEMLEVMSLLYHNSVLEKSTSFNLKGYVGNIKIYHKKFVLTAVLSVIRKRFVVIKCSESFFSLLQPSCS